MTAEKIAVVILAAGQGTRMKSARPKVMHPLAGRPMIRHLLEAVAALSPEKVAVVVGPGMDDVRDAVAPYPAVVQQDRLGTGHAVRQAMPLIGAFEGTVLVLFGDTPLITPETLKAMVEHRVRAPESAVTVLGFEPRDGGEYGRLAMGPDGLEAIVEHRDATDEQRRLRLCNSGAMAISGRHLPALLDTLDCDNAKGEYYLTGIVASARAMGLRCGVVEGWADELLGINSRAELAAAESVVQAGLRARALENGATLIDPGSVYFCWDTRLGRDVTVAPHVVFGPGAVIGDGVDIRSFCHIEGAVVAEGAVIGPFARLRPGADIGEDAHVGNFVEIKKATVEAGAKVNHLTYIGDARIGAKANIGAGTITCNYDGFRKSFTDIGAGAFIGSNSALVAPVTIGAGAIVGAGSVITANVEANALAVARSEQKQHAGMAERFRAFLRRGGNQA